jgi:hypothetical protein
MKKFTLFILGIIFLVGSSFTPKPAKSIGGIGGQAIYDSVAQRFMIKSLELNNYIKANSLRPGDLILEIDKVPIHKMKYGDVLSLVQGEVGTPMSLKVIRYNGIEKYYEIKRIRVTLDMQPTWWSVPDYKYYTLLDGLNYAVKELKLNGKNSIDLSSKIPNQSDRVYCNFNLKGAYESIYKKNEKGKYYHSATFVQSEDRSKAEGMYLYLNYQLKTLGIQYVKLKRTETILPDSKTLTYKVDEYSDVALIKMTIQLKMLQEYDTAENKNLWKVVIETKLNQ